MSVISRSQFRCASEPHHFFDVRNTPRLTNPHPPMGGMPAIVVPPRHVQQRNESKTPRIDFITLPPLPPAKVPQLLRESKKPSRILPSSTRSVNTRSVRKVVVTAKRAPSTRAAHHNRRGVHGDSQQVRALPALPPLAPRPPVQTRSLKTFERPSNHLDYTFHPTSMDMSPVDDMDRFDRRLRALEEAREPVHIAPSCGSDASARVLKLMFFLDLSLKSDVIRRLSDMELGVLRKRIFHEMGLKKQMSRDEFHVMVCRVLHDDFVSRRETHTLFQLFDDDKSGLVDADEFLLGFVSMLRTGADEIAFKYIAQIMEATEKESTSEHAFISRFEMQVLIEAVCRFYHDDPHAVQSVRELLDSFSFSSHMGRIPVSEFMTRIFASPELSDLFRGLPDERVSEMAGSIHRSKSEAELPMANVVLNVAADKFLCEEERQKTTYEPGVPQFWTFSGALFTKSKDGEVVQIAP